jgi:hypothetical protein
MTAPLAAADNRRLAGRPRRPAAHPLRRPALIFIRFTLPVPTPSSAVRLDRHDLWLILRRKAENPVPFIPDITECRVLEHHEDGLVREIVVRGTGRVRERVTFEPERRVVFQQLTDPDLEQIVNEIGEGEDGGLTLTLTIAVSPGGVERSRREAGFLADTERYFGGTLRSIVEAVTALAAQQVTP